MYSLLYLLTHLFFRTRKNLKQLNCIALHSLKQEDHKSRQISHVSHKNKNITNTYRERKKETDKEKYTVINMDSSL